MPDTDDAERGGDQADKQTLSSLATYVDQQIKQAIKQYDQSQTKRKKWRNSWRSASPITKAGLYVSAIAVVATMTLAFLAWRQLDAMKTIASSNTQQTQQLVEAANQMKTAAWTFSGASIGTNNAVWGAVGKLQLQADQVKRSASAALSASETAKGALALSDKALRVSERPYVTIQNIRFDPPLDVGAEINRVKFGVRNDGRTPALEIVEHITFLNNGTPAELPVFNEGEMLIPSNGGTLPVTVSIPKLATSSNGESIGVLKGTITYTDIFKDSHSTTFCFNFDAPWIKDWHPCPGKGGNRLD